MRGYGRQPPIALKSGQYFVTYSLKGEIFCESQYELNPRSGLYLPIARRTSAAITSRFAPRRPLPIDPSCNVHLFRRGGHNRQRRVHRRAASPMSRLDHRTSIVDIRPMRSLSYITSPSGFYRWIVGKQEVAGRPVGWPAMFRRRSSALRVDDGVVTMIAFGIRLKRKT
jgi:hypothetical protein